MLKNRAQLVDSHGLKFRYIVIFALTDQAHSHLPERLNAVRVSPIVGNGDFNEYMFSELTRNEWRLSLGLGYAWTKNLVLKAEYTLERGKEVDGTARNHQGMFGAELGFRF